MSRFFPLLALLVLLAPSAAQARKTKIKLATLAPKGSVFYTVLQEMGEDWKQASDGKVRLKVFAGGIAGDDSTVVRKMRLGTVSGGMLTSAGLSAIDKSVHALAIPMAYDSWAEFDYVHGKLRPKLEQIYADKGFIVLNWVDAGWVRFFAKKAATSPEALQARKLYITAGKPEITELWKAAGFNVVPLPSTEISTGLQSGLIEALPSTPQAALLMQWFKHAPHMIDVRWAPLIGATIVSKKAWDKIDPELRPELMRIARKAGAKLRAEARPADLKSVRAMQKRGLKIAKMTPEMQARWRAQVEKAYPSMRDTFVPGALFDEAMRHRAAFRKLGGFTDGADE